MNESEKNELNKEIVELLQKRGVDICWHEIQEKKTIEEDGYETTFYNYKCSCGKKYSSDWGHPEHHNPDFTTDSGKVQLLGEMMKRDDGYDFLDFIGHFKLFANIGSSYIHYEYMTDKDGSFALAARDFLRQEKGE